MDFNEVMKALESASDANTKKIYAKHGAKEPFFGVKVAELKKILKKTKKNHELSLALYKTGNSDAMYLAGLMADEKVISKVQLNNWVKKAYWSYLSEYTVPWVAAETDFGFGLGLEWIESKKENIAAAGWATLAYYAAVNEDELLNIKQYKALITRAQQEVHAAPNRVRYVMNGFIISVGTYVKELTSYARKAGVKVGKVEVLMDGTACKVPLAVEYLDKAVDKQRVGKKRKTARC